MKKKLLCLMLIVLSTWTLIGCGKDTVESGETLSEKNENSIIQFNSDSISDNTMEVIEGYIYPTSISDYVDIHGQMSVKITSIECPNGTIWHGEDEYNRLEMFETYEAAEEPYIVTFKEAYTNDTNILLVYCYTKEQAVEKGMIENVIPFTFKDFIVEGKMNVIAGKNYSTNLEDYINTETIDTIKITKMYNCFWNDERLDGKYVTEMNSGYATLDTTDINDPGYIVTITDTSCNYSQELYISIYGAEADTTGVLLAPTVE